MCIAKSISMVIRTILRRIENCVHQALLGQGNQNHV